MEEDLPQTYSASALWRTIASLLIYILVYYALFRELRSIILLVIVILVHETGHFLAMKKFGYRELKMFFIPFFGAMVSGKSNEVTPFQRAIMILSGPLPGIGIGLLMFGISVIFNLDILRFPALLFMVLNAINLLPVSPLDGGQFLQILYPSKNRILQTIFILILIIIVTWLAFRMRNYFLLILDLFLCYRLTVFFPVGHTTDDNDQELPEEISKGKKSMLLLLWFLAMIITIVTLYFFRMINGSFF